MSDTAIQQQNSGNEIHRARLFFGICLALVPTGASFALLANVLGQLKQEFILTNAQVGFIAGAAIWGMAISLLFLGPALEGFGMKRGTVAAFFGHVLGLVLMIASAPFASTDVGFWMLTLGAVVLAMGHGMIEVAGNPLTAALYPEDKTTKLNWFHAFFPIGILAGSLIGYGLSQLTGPLFHWTFQLGIILVPVITYGIMVLPQKFPKTETAEAGLPVGEMFKYTLTHPLMFLMLLLMSIAVSIELGAGRWIPEIFARIGVPGILLLSWISLIMIVLRLFASHFVERLSPPGMLTGAAVCMALGLFVFGIADGGGTAFIGATLFGLGVAFFFPTIVGIVSERLPKTGSLGIVLTCGVGLAAAGGIGNPGIGLIGDTQLARYLNDPQRRATTIALLESAHANFPAFREAAEQSSDALAELGFLAADIDTAFSYVESALDDYRNEGGQIVGNATPQALRAIGGAVPGEADRLLTAEHPDIETLSDEQRQQLRDELLGPEGTVAQRIEGDPDAFQEFVSRSAAHAAVAAGMILGPAEGYGGQRALLLISWIPLLLVVAFGAMYLNDKRTGGYRVMRLERVVEETGTPHTLGEVMDQAAEKASRPLGPPKHQE